MKSYKEVSKFDQWFMMLIQLALFLLFLVCIIYLLKHEIYNIPAGKGGRSISFTELLIVSFIPLLILLFLRYITLTVSVSADSIFVNLKPFRSQKYLFENLRNIRLIKYDFLGYGLRYSTTYGKVYNVKGNYGLSFTTNRGEKILIGIKDPKSFLEYLNDIELPIKNETKGNK